MVLVPYTVYVQMGTPMLTFFEYCIGTTGLLQVTAVTAAIGVREDVLFQLKIRGASEKFKISCGNY